MASSVVSGASKGQVTKVLNLIRSIHKGTLEKDDEQLIKRKLTSKQYGQLLALIAEDQSLQGFFDDKLR